MLYYSATLLYQMSRFLIMNMPLHSTLQIALLITFLTNFITMPFHQATMYSA
jgi:uncharacterized protein (DUF2062 family)